MTQIRFYAQSMIFIAELKVYNLKIQNLSHAKYQPKQQDKYAKLQSLLLKPHHV